MTTLYDPAKYPLNADNNLFPTEQAPANGSGEPEIGLNPNTGEFTNGDPVTGLLPTRLPAEHINLLTKLNQSIIMHALGKVDNTDVNQLKTAIDKLINNSASTLDNRITNEVNTINQAVLNNQLNLNAHANDKNNPHTVTKAQIGLGNVPNYTATSSISDNSTNKFATAKAVKTAYDKANSIEGMTVTALWAGKIDATLQKRFNLADNMNNYSLLIFVAGTDRIRFSLTTTLADFVVNKSVAWHHSKSITSTRITKISNTFFDIDIGEWGRYMYFIGGIK